MNVEIYYTLTYLTSGLNSSVFTLTNLTFYFITSPQCVAKSHAKLEEEIVEVRQSFPISEVI